MTGHATVVVIGAGQAGLSAAHHRTARDIFDLPGFPKPPIDHDEPSRTAVPRCFEAFERASGLA